MSPGKVFVYLPGSRENAVLLVANADIVGRETLEFDLAEDEKTIRNRYGILGADDRAGCAMLWLLRNTGHGLLVTDGEEWGSAGSEFLIRKIPLIRPGKDAFHRIRPELIDGFRPPLPGYLRRESFLRLFPRAYR